MNQPTNISYAQQQVAQWIADKKIGYFPPHEILARLVEEVGELAREVNHRYGSKFKKSSEEVSDIEMELGDILFTIACLANSLNLNLDRGIDSVIAKYNARDKDRWEKK